jgi:hypothetical protein
MPWKAGRRKRISAEVVLLKTVRFKFWITGNSGILGSGCHSCRRELLTKTGCISLNATFVSSENSDPFHSGNSEPSDNSRKG